MKILLLEDDAILGDLIYNSLKEKNYEVMHAEDGEEAMEFIEDEKFDLFVLDINVPFISGLELLKNIREYSITTPTIMITAYQDTEHLKKGFNLGCDDYIKKPFDLEELHHRIRNLSKRYSIEESNSVTFDSKITLIKDKHTLVVDCKNYEISKKESSIILYLFNHKGRTVSFEELLQNIWHFDDVPSETTIRVYVKNLRNILGKDRIKTTRGVGYSYEP